LAGVVANTALGVGKVVLDGYISLANADDG
jgi:hypothetical protein